MLQSILGKGIPLVESIDLDDPWGLGIRLRIFRKDSTGYEDAISDHPKTRKYLGEIRKIAAAEAVMNQGMRRGKGGKVKRSRDENASRAPSLYVEDLAEQIAEHLFEILALSKEACGAFRIDPVISLQVEERVKLLQNTPVDDSGQELCFPAAFRSKEVLSGSDDLLNKTEPVWNIADVRDPLDPRGGDDEVPWGGYGNDTNLPTLCNMLGLWIIDSSGDAALFGVTETEEGSSTVRPTSPGTPASSAGSESSNDGP